MTNTFEERKEEFNRECKTINLRFEYPHYTGSERYAIVTALSEEELLERYGDVIRRYYSPYLLLSEEHNKVIVEYQNIEAKYRMRNLRCGHAFDINDGEFEEHHPELAFEEDIVEKIELKDNIENLRRILKGLPEIQKRRIIAHFFYGKSFREIGKEEGVNHSVISRSVKAGIEKIKKSL